MTPWKLALQEIGKQLDQGIFPRAGNSGIVIPSTISASLKPAYEVSENDGQRTRRSETGSWERTEGRQRTSSGTRTSDTATSILSTGIAANYETELETIQAVYPGARIWRQDDGFWLESESLLLPGLNYRAVFLTGISTKKNTVKSWGFWWYGHGIYEWIGPRHTNFPDGSVCAFEPRDGTWVIGDPIVTLLDMYSLWALRHLHLKVFDRWPGPQAVPYVYERITEVHEDELCGCGTYHKQYRDCCWKKDRSMNQIAIAVNFLTRANLNRKPPNIITDCIRNCTTPPDLNTLF